MSVDVFAEDLQACVIYFRNDLTVSEKQIHGLCHNIINVYDNKHNNVRLCKA